MENKIKPETTTERATRLAAQRRADSAIITRRNNQ